MPAVCGLRYVLSGRGGVLLTSRPAVGQTDQRTVLTSATERWHVILYLNL